MDVAEEGMVDRGRGESFPPEALPSERVLGDLRWEELERDLALELEVMGQVDNTHPTLPDLFEYPVLRKRIADHLPGNVRAGAVADKGRLLR